MYAIEFEADVKNGMIKLPSQYSNLNSKHLKIIALLDDSVSIDATPEKPELTDEYIQNNWREIIMTGLSNYDEAYYKSDKYKEDRGTKLMEKYK